MSKALSSGYDGCDNVDHQNSIQVLHPVMTYHFDDVCVCFVKDSKDNEFISKQKKLPIIINDIVYDLTKMDERDSKDHVMQLREIYKNLRGKKCGESLSRDEDCKRSC